MLNLQSIVSLFRSTKQILPTLNAFQVNDQKSLENIIQENRHTLQQVPDWIPPGIFEGSYFNYGIPEFLKPIINLPIGIERTYTDLICYYSKMFKSINYLELGVSVGKNFYQLSNHFTESNLFGFDIENINPVLEKHFTSVNNTEWDTKAGSIRLDKSHLSTYKFKTNKIKYLAGDIWDENSWANLKGTKFNIIFSDALHDPKALLWEYEMILRYELLDDQFIYVWDDLNHGLEQSFFEIASSLKKRYKLQKNQIILGKVNGWCGINEQSHDVGIVSNLQLT